MESGKLASVIEQVRTLTVMEQRHLRSHLDTLLEGPQALMTEDDFERQMVASGLLSAPSPCPDELTPDRDWHPIPVSGPPVSQTIIDERR